MSAAAAAAPVTLHRPLAPEEAGRAHFYALLGRLLAAPPDNSLLYRIANAEPLEGDSGLAHAWSELVAASSVMDADAGAEEYEALFAGVGKSLVSIYAGFYIGATAVEHPRVRLRADLAALGLAPRPDATEPEDHFAGLFETMRVLVGGGAGRGPATLDAQRRFFQAHIEPGARRFFDAMAAAGPSNYYRKIAAWGAAFVALEAESFQLESSSDKEA